MTEFEKQALALLESIDRSLAGLTRSLRAIDEITLPLPGSGSAGWPAVGAAPDEPCEHRNLRRGEPWRRGEAHRWPR